MQTETIRKPSCIVDFDNETEIDTALAEAENSPFISFETFLKETMEFKNNLSKNV